MPSFNRMTGWVYQVNQHSCVLPYPEELGQLWRCVCHRLARAVPTCQECRRLGRAHAGQHIPGLEWAPASRWTRIRCLGRYGDPDTTPTLRVTFGRLQIYMHREWWMGWRVQYEAVLVAPVPRLVMFRWKRRDPTLRIEREAWCSCVDRSEEHTTALRRDRQTTGEWCPNCGLRVS
jgi:hypothetical protein